MKEIKSAWKKQQGTLNIYIYETGSSPADKDLGQLVYWTQSGSVHMQLRRPNVSWAASKEMWPQVEEEDSPHLLHSHDIPCEVLHPAVYNTCARLAQCRDLGLKRDCLKKLEECRSLHMTACTCSLRSSIYTFQQSHRLEQAVYRGRLKCYQTRMAVRQPVRGADSIY